MLTLFTASLVCLALSAAALALGLVRSKPLLGGCRTRMVAGRLLPGCEACPEPDRGATDAQRA